MKLSEQIEKESELIQLQINFYRLVNGVLGAVVLGGGLLLVYKIVGLVI